MKFGATTVVLLLALSGVALALILLLAGGFLGGDTDVAVSYGPTGVYAEVEGMRLELPHDKLPSSGVATAGLTPVLQGPSAPSDSLYWQPGQPGVFGFLGSLGERLQSLRPAAKWVVISKSSGELHARLDDGRTSARIDLPTDLSGKNGYAFVIRPERRGIAWWRVQNGQPVEQLASAIYRPAGRNSVRDLAGELALVALVAGLLAVICVATSWLVRLFTRARGSTAALRPPASTYGQRMGSGNAVPLALFAGGAIVAAAVCLQVLDGIPHVQDDVAYLFQAKIFALARSWVPVPPGPEFFANGFIQMFDGRWFTKYPPGYPLLLAPAIWAGAPWLINALSAGVTLALVYLMGRRMYGVHVAVWAGLLGLVSPWIIFMSGSYMSHPTTMMWAALFAYSLVRIRDDANSPSIGFRPSGLVYPIVGGLSIGMAFITREWTALGIGVGAAVWALGDLIFSGGRELRAKLVRYALLVAGFLPPIVFLLYENRQLTGDWFRLAQDLVGSYDTPGFGPGHGDAQGHTPALGVYNTLVYFRTLATVFDGWPAPLALAPIFLGLFAWIGERPRTRLVWDALNILCVAGLVGAYFLWWSSTTVFGPRYWFEAMPFLLLLAGRGLDLLGRISASGPANGLSRRLRWLVPGVLFALLTLYTLTQTMPFQIAQYRDYNGISVSALRSAEAAHLKKALVFVALDPTKPNRDYGKVFFANDPLLGGDVVYARDLGPEKNRVLLGLFPGRAPYWLPLEGTPQLGFGPES